MPKTAGKIAEKLRCRNQTSRSLKEQTRWVTILLCRVRHGSRVSQLQEATLNIGMELSIVGGCGPLVLKHNPFII